LKAALTHLGYIGGPARPPLQPIAGDAVARIAHEMDLLAEITCGVPA
jgi:hypothetical protein